MHGGLSKIKHKSNINYDITNKKNIKLPKIKNGTDNYTKKPNTTATNYSIENNSNIPIPIKIPENNKKNNKNKSPIEKIKQLSKTVLSPKQKSNTLDPVPPNKKKWFPNSTGREIQMTSRFGIENNHKI